MMRRIRKILRYSLILFLFMIISALAVFAISTAPKWGDALLKVEVRSHNGDEVYVSVPLSLLKTSFSVMPKEIRRLCRELELTPDMITDELKTMAGEDLVRITGGDDVRVYIEGVSKDSLASQGFLKVSVREHGRGGHHIHVWIPRGLITFAGMVVRVSGVVDHYVELPPEIAHLKVFHKIEM
ncbi:MAG: hypothetical protein JXR73_04925 [Candidatus Omnitrophica bacterium]|nr:hypothetical protein [Candidatus Omnitrophota bacterium]